VARRGPQRLVYDWHWEHSPEGPVASIVAVHFRDVGGRTEVEVVHTGIEDPAARANHADGWSHCIDGLDAILNHLV
jgi:uncharacterized protein YndB with AHSA1/START domain